MAIHRSSFPGLRFDKALLPTTPAPDHQFGPCLFVSRETGAGGGEIARRAAESLDWHLLDKEILDELSSLYGTSRSMLDNVDEKSVDWLTDIFYGWVEGHGFSQLAFVHRLHGLFTAAARQGNAVIVGRGARFMLPREAGFSVRIVAPLGDRVNRVALRRGVSMHEARTYIERMDRLRNEFLERYFHHDALNPTVHDLVINTERLGIEGSLTVLLAATHSWLADRGHSVLPADTSEPVSAHIAPSP